VEPINGDWPQLQRVRLDNFAACLAGNAAQPLRAALTGRPASPGIFDVLEVLGRTESLARLNDQAEQITQA